ncbi:MAG: hypothetical protein JWQ78_942, partial [Sediminibacterium sp.]|nr:hypothetical protein [Sediminibacterium sp.]
ICGSIFLPNTCGSRWTTAWIFIADERRVPAASIAAWLRCAVFSFLYLGGMKALVITPKSDNEYKFLSNLLTKLGVGISSLSKEELEDIGLAKMMHNINKTKKASRSEILKKLNS